MRRIKPALCALMTLFLLLSLCACGGASPEQTLAAAQERLSAVGSLRYAVDMDMRLSSEGRSLETEIAGFVSLTSEPAAVYLECAAFTDGSPAWKDRVCALFSGGLYRAYINRDGEWLRQDLSGGEELARYDIRLASARWLGAAAGVTDAGEQELYGRTARRYDLSVSAGAVDGIMEASGAYEALSVLDIGDTAARELLSGLGEIPLSVWVGGEGLPLRYELDLAGVFGALTDRLAKTPGCDYPAVNVERLSVRLELSDFDAVPVIELPAGALDARPLEGEELF